MSVPCRLNGLKLAGSEALQFVTPGFWLILRAAMTKTVAKADFREPGPSAGGFQEMNMRTATFDMRTATFAAAIVLACMAGSVQAAAPAQEGTTDKGEALVDASGKTLYTYDKDAEGKSNCNDKCAQNWPPLAATAEAASEGDWTIIKRDDGTSQWAYKGKPLYTWVKDEKPGVASGDGVGGVWHLATP